jgi:hypothetical protein
MAAGWIGMAVDVGHGFAECFVKPHFAVFGYAANDLFDGFSVLHRKLSIGGIA